MHLLQRHDCSQPAGSTIASDALAMISNAERQQTHKELRAIVDAIADRNGKRAEKLVSDHLLRTLATINIWR
jgi:DNA-binding GntR family transcriptional regulator